MNDNFWLIQVPMCIFMWTGVLIGLGLAFNMWLDLIGPFFNYDDGKPKKEGEKP